MRFLDENSIYAFLSLFSLFYRCQLEKPVTLLCKEFIRVSIDFGNMPRPDRMTKAGIQLLSCKLYVRELTEFPRIDSTPSPFLEDDNGFS